MENITNTNEDREIVPQVTHPTLISFFVLILRSPNFPTNRAQNLSAFPMYFKGRTQLQVETSLKVRLHTQS